MIRLTVPGTLEYRDIAMRVVSAAAKLVAPSISTPTVTGEHVRGALLAPQPDVDEFDLQLVSAFGEAFNNIAIHAYGDGPTGDVALEIEISDDEVVLRIFDHGKSFEPTEVPLPELDMLPERGMGLFIIKSFVDELVYTPGSPNVLVLVKRRGRVPEPATEAAARPKRQPRNAVRATAMPRRPGPAEGLPARAPGWRGAPPKHGSGRK